jgi:hypothetical protein
VLTVFFIPVTTKDVAFGPAVFGSLLSGTQITLYPVMAAPPFDTGGVQLIVADATPAIPVTPRTAEGGPVVGAVGVAESETAEATELPTAFLETTVNVRGVPLAKPVNVVVKTFPSATGLPTDGVTVYPVITEPPFEAGAVHEIVTEFVPATAVTPVGAPGIVDADIYTLWVY